MADDDEVVLIREFQPSEPAAASGDTHGTMRLGPITAAPNIPDGTWFVWGGSTCSPRRADGAGDGQAELRLAETPVVDDTQLTLLVLERRCASGRSADGRIDLGEPLGDRTVVDASLVPPRELQVDAEGPSSDPATEDRDAAVERALSFEVWPDYTLLVDTRCECLDGTYEVVVRDGEVVSRRAVTPTGLPADADPQPALAPSVAEVLERLRLAYDEDPESITDIAVAEDGTLIRVAFDPWRDVIDDEVTHRFQVDVDAPGDPVRDG